MWQEIVLRWLASPLDLVHGAFSLVDVKFQLSFPRIAVKIAILFSMLASRFPIARAE